MWIGKQLPMLSMKLFARLHGVSLKNILIFDYTELANTPMIFFSYCAKSYSTENNDRSLLSELLRRADSPFVIRM